MSFPIPALGIQERHLTTQDTRSTKKLVELCGLVSSWNLVSFVVRCLPQLAYCPTKSAQYSRIFKRRPLQRTPQKS